MLFVVFPDLILYFVHLLYSCLFSHRWVLAFFSLCGHRYVLQVFSSSVRALSSQFSCVLFFFSKHTIITHFHCLVSPSLHTLHCCSLFISRFLYHFDFIVRVCFSFATCTRPLGTRFSWKGCWQALERPFTISVWWMRYRNDLFCTFVAAFGLQYLQLGKN